MLRIYTPSGKGPFPLATFRANTPSLRIYADAFPLNTPQLPYFTGLHLRDNADRANPLASPMLTPSLRGASPATIINAEIDPLRDDGALYYSALKAAGVPVAGRALREAFGTA